MTLALKVGQVGMDVDDFKFDNAGTLSLLT
jgi:hypothetical protein